MERCTRLCMPNKFVALAGVLIGVVQIIGSSMYNFHEIGVVLGIFGVLISLAIYILLRPDKKPQQNVVQLHQWLSLNSENDDLIDNEL